jgi:(p)ppGpp synthase/HD superfamily hydrolase
MKPLWQEAASFAMQLHAGQTRDDGVTPYGAHPVRVAMTVRDVFECDDHVCLAAAYLHDVIEDTPADYDDIAERFGTDVADCVAALTKDMRMPEAQREEAYDQGLIEADWRAKLIKLADTYDNLCDLSSVEKRGRVIERCRRAITIAEPATGDHPSVPRAIDALKRLMASET